jgi:anti-sigma B factor antagonist
MPEGPLLNIEDVDGVTAVGFHDASILDAATAQRIGQQLYDLVESKDRRRVVLDLADVRFLSSRALGVLLTLRRKADAAGASVVLAGVRPDLTKIFKITKLDEMFEFFADRAAAIEHLSE